MSREWTGSPGGGERDGDSKRAFSSAAPPSVFTPIPAPQSSPRAGDGGRQPRGKAERDGEGMEGEGMEVGLSPPWPHLPAPKPAPAASRPPEPRTSRDRPARVLWSWALGLRRWAP